MKQESGYMAVLFKEAELDEVGTQVSEGGTFFENLLS